MRVALVLLIGVLSWGSVQGQEPKFGKRYGIQADLSTFPQDTPKNTLASVLKAIEAGRIKYLLAQLSDPDWVDQRVKLYGGDFDQLVKETTGLLGADPTAMKSLRRLLKEGEWEDGDAASSAKLKDSKDQVFFRKLEMRWFLENRKKQQ
jgi:hypothetical protein